MSVSYDGTFPAPFIAQAIKEFGGDFQYIWSIVAPMLTSKEKEGTIGKRSREKIAGDGPSVSVASRSTSKATVKKSRLQKSIKLSSQRSWIL